MNHTTTKKISMIRASMADLYKVQHTLEPGEFNFRLGSLLRLLNEVAPRKVTKPKAKKHMVDKFFKR